MLQSVIQIPSLNTNVRTIPLVDVLTGIGEEKLLEEEASSSVFLYPNPEGTTCYWSGRGGRCEYL
ncbi:MAG TPA: hypothetical protein ENJ45_04490 [Phaeodactylibacter sp.]|nr:hypothetical protein [Phaeodactylibacter sp.]